MADGPTGARVDGMGDTLAPFLVVVSIVPGGGQGEVTQWDDDLNTSLLGSGLSMAIRHGLPFGFEPEVRTSPPTSTMKCWISSLSRASAT